jgi:glycosyltransferase involved in cell wall biosynthesis
VVVPDVAPIVERLTPEVNAVVIPPGDVDGLAAALVRLRDDPGLRNQLAANARAAAVQWSWDHQVERVVAAVERT